MIDHLLPIQNSVAMKNPVWRTIISILALQLFSYSSGWSQDDSPDNSFNSVAWVQNSAEYRIATKQAYRFAKVQLDVGLKDAKWSADSVQLKQGGFGRKPPAVILDIDETVLDNSPYNARLIADKEKYDLKTWEAWCREKKATAIPGALEFIQYARRKNVRVFYISNRTDAVKDATVENLRKLGFPAAANYVLTKNSRKGRPSNKASRRATVAKNHRIVLLIGDNLGDFTSAAPSDNQQQRNQVAEELDQKLGSRWIMLPNPVYGSWTFALPEQPLRLVRDAATPATAPEPSLPSVDRAKLMRVATYNIRWLSSETTMCGTSIKVTDVRTQSDRYGKRLDRLREIVKKMDADIIGLQEIRDRKALELIFRGNGDWTIVIDDDDTECQKLALAVRRPYRVVGAQGNKLNAGRQHFLFENEDELYFPSSRDVLHIQVMVPGKTDPVHVLVHHAKSRRGGRKTTTFRRVGAAQRMVKRLRAEFRDRDYVLLGDFNDNPDDQSLNVLESGESRAQSKMESKRGAFLVNLTESLVAKNMVSHGRSYSDVKDGKINLVQKQSRRKSFEGRDSDKYDPSIDALLDQILVPKKTFQWYRANSIRIFNDAVAVSGQRDSKASDHLPVYADFILP